MSGKNCLVCGRSRRCLRYGAKCCNACASFFIRTPKANNYVCKNYHFCLIKPSIKGIRCQKCRYLKCLESGMISSASFKPTLFMDKSCVDLDKEYMIFAKILDLLFISSIQNPERLFDFIKDDNPLFMDLILIQNIDLKVDLKDHVKNWYILLKNNKFPLDEVKTLVLLILFNIKLPWLPPFQQNYINFLQQNAIIRNKLQFKNLETLILFAKLTTFFVSQFLTIYCHQKL